jgi:hypothetical protein
LLTLEVAMKNIFLVRASAKLPQLKHPNDYFFVGVGALFHLNYMLL